MTSRRCAMEVCQRPLSRGTDAFKRESEVLDAAVPEIEGAVVSPRARADPWRRRAPIGGPDGVGGDEWFEAEASFASAPG